MADPHTSPPATPRRILTVTELNQRLRRCLQERFASVWVSGEVSDLARPRSGHIYLSLKDGEGQLRAVMWRNNASRLKFNLEDGMQVHCEGQIDVYPARGNYQLIIRSVEPQGIGALQLAFNQLHDRLAREGLFDPQRKVLLPRFPQRLAVITSPTGAAIHDFLEVHRRRWVGAEILVVPTRVQGTEAADEIVAALQLVQQLRPAPDVIVLTRGGGSLEDLWCFNQESVVREVATAKIPTVSAIGHEIDVTLCDLAADIRALTPSEAAERLSPSRTELTRQLQQIRRQLANQISRQLHWNRERVHQLANRPALSDPTRVIRDLSRRVDENEQRLNLCVGSKIQAARQMIEKLASQLEALSPLSVLGRGYSLTRRNADGQLVRTLDDVTEGDKLLTQLADGRIVSQVLAATLHGSLDP